MGFATLEDIQGPIELVLFPRTWDKFGRLLAPDRVLIAEGKVDATGGDPKILVDRLDEMDLEAALNVPEIDLNAYIPPAVAAVYGENYQMGALAEMIDDGSPDGPDPEEFSPAAVIPGGAQAGAQAPAAPAPAASAEDYPPEPDDWDQLPPPPDFPDMDWFPVAPGPASTPAAQPASQKPAEPAREALQAAGPEAAPPAPARQSSPVEPLRVEPVQPARPARRSPASSCRAQALCCTGTRHSRSATRYPRSPLHVCRPRCSTSARPPVRSARRPSSCA
jgi:hypothetical protein